MRGGGGEDSGGAGGGHVEMSQLEYRSFSNVRYEVKFDQNRKVDTEDTYEGFSERTHGILTVTLSGGSGTATLELDYYRVGNAEQPPTSSPAHNRTISFTVSPTGAYRTSETSIDAMPLRALTAALFPDLPEVQIDPGSSATWTQRSPEGLFAAIPAPGPLTPEIRRFESTIAAGAAGEYPESEPVWLNCLSFFHTDWARLEGRARVDVAGEQKPAEMVSKVQGTFVLDYEHGVPCEAHVRFDGYLRLNPRSPEKVVTDFEYRVFARRIPPGR